MITMRKEKGPGPVLKEALREVQLMAGLSEWAGGDRGIAIGVTSPNYGDGKTTIAIGLAASLASDLEADVTLVDGDLHTTSVGREYGIASEEGLADVVTGALDLSRVGHRVNSRITVIPAGRPPEDTARMARSASLVDLVENMKRASRFVVIDLPATLHSMDAPVLAQRCDGVLVVVRSNRTTRLDLDRTLHLLREVNVIGLVLNGRRLALPGWMTRTLNLRG